MTITDGGQHGSGAVAAAATWDYVNDVSTDGVTDVQLVDQGNGKPGGQNYSLWTTVTVEGGPGVTSPAQVVPTIEGGVITGFTINSPGAGYRQAPITGTGIRKFVDSLPVLNADGTHLNNLGQGLRIATPTVVTEHNADGSVKLQADGVTPVTSDYYIIGEREYKQKLHSDLPATTLRGYVQLDATGNPIGPVQYLGPIIVAHKDRAVRIKLVNQLPTGEAGNLPIPVDRTYMGASDTDNRTAMHLHGGNTPWISDGT
ncbi:MAG: hypothetical protein FJ189_07305, partial [Gammaproteobacteria bacterium]|nr:hypothetical protein [Gammaproteobacteria bacterium]